MTSLKVSPWQAGERNVPEIRGAREELSFLVRYAILAPSNYNTQPWKFWVSRNRIVVFSDPDRWLKTVDLEQRELHISLGCAIENLLVAAEHFNYDCRIDYLPDESNPGAIAVIDFEPGCRHSSEENAKLFNAIFTRHTNHRVYEPRAVPFVQQQRLNDCCVEDGIWLYMASDLAMKRKLDELIDLADSTEFADSDYREEMDWWISQGMFGAQWLFAKLSHLAVSYLDAGHLAPKKDSDLLLSAPLMGIICSENDDRETQVKVGRVFERICLTASALGLSIQPLSQIVEVAEVRAELTSLIPAKTGLPQQPFRLGYAEPEREHTDRRPLEQVMM